MAFALPRISRDGSGPCLALGGGGGLLEGREFRFEESGMMKLGNRPLSERARLPEGHFGFCSGVYLQQFVHIERK